MALGGSTANWEYFSQRRQSKALSQVLEITLPASSWRQRRSASGSSAKSDFQHRSMARLVRRSLAVRHAAETIVAAMVNATAKKSERKRTCPTVQWKPS